ncbi:hypothetical protein CONPUDRAFT_160991 [Coniophora puteana RWD-64-598 SS2]|uniref:F-box domain-containing protein n=1 Tax=Coniophora puteana (strain RWD-64-598) TaxID=741705 RepID=A0A5M3N4D3_CONPW|nr:uncharacterized protein CONPUDRAFT_160991 [Coniophora puteana RWD-64-598 SS2]EIW86168.1 hypothetical protein CONPUDRAFT_160991 [Coniophora puteana RWD-64-598 SS2]
MLMCPALDQTSFIHLSQLKTLTSIEFGVLSDIASTPALPFPALESLVIRLGSFPETLFIMGKLARFLSAIHIASNGVPSLEIAREAFGTILIRPGSLTRSTLQTGFADMHPSLLQSSSRGKFFSPLLSFSTLQVLDWSFAERVEFTDAEMEQLARAWPQLERPSIIFTPAITSQWECCPVFLPSRDTTIICDISQYP